MEIVEGFVVLLVFEMEVYWIALMVEVAEKNICFVDVFIGSLLDCFDGGSDGGFCCFIGVLNVSLLAVFSGGCGWGIICFVGVLIKGLLDCFSGRSGGGICCVIGVLAGGLLDSLVLMMAEELIFLLVV